MWLGCEFSEMTNAQAYGRPIAKAITDKLQEFDGKVCHPMILPIMFADVERQRQISLVREKRSQLRNKFSELHDSEHYLSALPSVSTRESNAGCKQADRTWHGTTRQMVGKLQQLTRTAFSQSSEESEKSSPTAPASSDIFEQTEADGLELSDGYSVDEEGSISTLWTDTLYIKNELIDWNTQLEKMRSHVEELHNPLQAFGLRWPDVKVEAWQHTSARLQDRLRELLEEYDSYIRECTGILEGFQLAMTMVRRTRCQL